MTRKEDGPMTTAGWNIDNVNARQMISVSCVRDRRYWCPGESKASAVASASASRLPRYAVRLRHAQRRAGEKRRKNKSAPARPRKKKEGVRTTGTLPEWLAKNRRNASAPCVLSFDAGNSFSTLAFVFQYRWPAHYWQISTRNIIHSGPD